MRRSGPLFFAPLLLLFAALCPAVVAASADEVVFERVWPGYRDSDSFTRLGEYFGAAPDATNRHALRSQPQRRDGYYWLVRTRTTTARTGCTLELQVRRPGATEPTRHTFAVDVAPGSHALHAGLTGTDWSDADERPVAWRLSLTAADGTVLATETSFLWTDEPPSSPSP